MRHALPGFQLSLQGLESFPATPFSKVFICAVLGVSRVPSWKMDVDIVST